MSDEETEYFDIKELLRETASKETQGRIRYHLEAECGADEEDWSDQECTIKEEEDQLEPLPAPQPLFEAVCGREEGGAEALKEVLKGTCDLCLDDTDDRGTYWRWEGGRDRKREQM